MQETLVWALYNVCSLWRSFAQWHYTSKTGQNNFTRTLHLRSGHEYSNMYRNLNTLAIFKRVPFHRIAHSAIVLCSLRGWETYFLWREDAVFDSLRNSVLNLYDYTTLVILQCYQVMEPDLYFEGGSIHAIYYLLLVALGMGMLIAGMCEVPAISGYRNENVKLLQNSLILLFTYFCYVYLPRPTTSNE